MNDKTIAILAAAGMIALNVFAPGAIPSEHVQMPYLFIAYWFGKVMNTPSH